MAAPRHLYVHVPFCARRCSYCDFSIAVRRRVPTDEYHAALARELGLRHRRESLVVETLYFGGGTPSRLGADGVTRMLELLVSHVSLAEQAEVTLEANPEDVTPEAVRAWRAAGVNRLSIGGQSFDERALAWMRRTHGAEQVARAADVARAGGIENLSLDLIFALPSAVGRDWERDLGAALALRPAHLSLYGLTVEAGTPLGRWRDRGTVLEATDASYEREFLLAHAMLTDAGYEHYEVSNYALPARESRHNSAYWARRPYVGLGPAAHGFDGERRRWNVAPYAEWARLLAAGRDPVGGSEVLTEEERATEQLYLGLRTGRGVPLEAVGPTRAGVWTEAGWARVYAERVVLTPLGWLRLDALTADLTWAGSRY